MDPFLIAAWVVIFVFGACIGSFLNVCVSRWPAELSVVRPRSRCPKCETQIAWYDNIPLVSWLVLRAKCRACGNPISAQYPLVELVVGVMWVLAVRGGGRGGAGWGGAGMTGMRGYCDPWQARRRRRAGTGIVRAGQAGRARLGWRSEGTAQ